MSVLELENIHHFTDMSHIRELSPNVRGPSTDYELYREFKNVGHTSYCDRENDRWYFGKDANARYTVMSQCRITIKFKSHT